MTNRKAFNRMHRNVERPLLAVCHHLTALCFSECNKILSLSEAMWAVRTSEWLKLYLHLTMEEVVSSGWEE